MILIETGRWLRRAYKIAELEAQMQIASGATPRYYKVLASIEIRIRRWLGDKRW